jgi:hypothetical protein
MLTMMLKPGPTRWATSDGVFLFQVPEVGGILPIDTAMLLSSSLHAISIFFETCEIKFSDDALSIIRINFHPPFANESDTKNQGYVIHSTFNQGLCFQSSFYANEINNELSEFEKAFLDSVANNLINRLISEGRPISDIPYLQNQTIIRDIEAMFHEIDTNYQSLVASWSLSQGPDCQNSRFDFIDVLYSGKIRMEELFYDLGERAIESYNMLLMSKEEKIILYKIAKSLVSLANLLYDGNTNKTKDELKFSHSEIILEANQSKKLYRLDVRSYELEGEEFCDITIMSN